jgi:hypothetical protein
MFEDEELVLKSEKLCKECGERGHFRRKCNRQEELCVYCLENHDRRYCQSEGGCFVCGNYDHIKMQCKFKSYQRCQRCKKVHRSNNCQYLLGDSFLISNDYFENRTFECIRCEKLGHFSCSVFNDKTLTKNIKNFDDGIFNSDYCRRMEGGEDFTVFLNEAEIELAKFEQNFPNIESNRVVFNENTSKISEENKLKKAKVASFNRQPIAKVQRSVDHYQNSIDIFSKNAIDEEDLDYNLAYMNFYKGQTGNYEKEFEALSDESDYKNSRREAKPSLSAKSLIKKRDLANMKKRNKRKTKNKAQFYEPPSSKGRGKGISKFSNQRPLKNLRSRKR